MRYKIVMQFRVSKIVLVWNNINVFYWINFLILKHIINYVYVIKHRRFYLRVISPVSAISLPRVLALSLNSMYPLNIFFKVHSTFSPQFYLIVQFINYFIFHNVKRTTQMLLIYFLHVWLLKKKKNTLRKEKCVWTFFKSGFD